MTAPHPVDQVPPAPKLAVLGLQHVLMMYAGAVAVPLIVGRALQLNAAQIGLLISADLFVCGVVTIIQTLGLSRWFGIRLPVMMGVTFASVGPMVVIATQTPGVQGARQIFGAVIAAGLITILIAPLISRLLRFFPPLVTGTIILVIGVTLMPIPINWIFGNPNGPATAPSVVDPRDQQWVDAAGQYAGTSGSPLPAPPPGFEPAATLPNPAYARVSDLVIAAVVLAVIIVVARFGRGFLANIAVLLGIVAGGILCALIGRITWDSVSEAAWFAPVTPLRFGIPLFDPVHILTMTIVMVVVLIESTGMFLALGKITDKPVTRAALSAGLRTDGLGTVIGGLFNTFPYTSFSQNVGLVAVSGVRSRYVCTAAGVILIILGSIPKIGATVEVLPTAVLGGAGLAMFGMVAATGIRILSEVDFAGERNNAWVVAISLGVGLIPVIAPRFSQWLPDVIHPLINSGILLATFTAVLLNAILNRPRIDETDRAGVLVESR